MWERWNSYSHEEGFGDASMNSFNHYAYGSIGAWLYNTVAGIEIDPTQPAYKHAILHPQPGGGLTSARGSIETPYGLLRSDWLLDGGTFDWTVAVPPNTTATATVPLKGAITVNGEEIEGSTVELAAGEYRIVVG